jgi:hypothetical protein
MNGVLAPFTHESPFHTDSPEYPPTHRNVYHDNSLCDHGKAIKQEGQA